MHSEMMLDSLDATGSWSVYKPSLEALSKAGIKVCLIRDDPETLNSALELDLLIAADKLASTMDILDKFGWALLDTGTFIPLKRALVRWHRGFLLKIDLHLELVDASLIYMDSNWMLQTAVETSDGYWLPSSEAWYLHVILHCILGKTSLDQKYHDRLHFLFDNGIDRKIIDRESRRYGLQLCLESLWSNPVQQLCNPEIVKCYRQSVRRCLLQSVPGNRIRSVVRKLWWYLGHWLGRRRGFVIAVVGPDGAGKTTFLNEMKRALNQLEIPRRSIYMGPWEYPMLPTSRWIRKLGASPLDRISNTDISVAPTRRYFKMAKGLCKRYLYYSNVLLELWARYYLRIWPQLLQRRVVIADRYAYDLEVGYYNTLVQNSTHLRRLIANVVPRPAFTILLDNDVDVIWERKQEYPRDVIEKSLSRYREIANRRNFYIIRTDRPVECLVSEFIQDRWIEMTSLRKDGTGGQKIAWYEFYTDENLRKIRDI